MIIFLFVLEERDPSYILYWEYRGQITDIQINPSGRRILQLINNSIWIDSRTEEFIHSCTLCFEFFPKQLRDQNQNYENIYD